MTLLGEAGSPGAEASDRPASSANPAGPDPSRKNREAIDARSFRPAQERAAAVGDADRQAAWILLAFLAARLAFAFALGFGVDEAYTLPISRDLRLSYFDHPPLHQWIAHFAGLVSGETVAARLPFVALFAATGWLIYRLTSELFGPRAGLIALFALNATPFFFASAGTWIVPDGPLLFGLALAAFALARLFFAAGGDERRVWRLWLLAGLGFGLAGLSKYIGALAPLGLLAFLAISPSERRWFRHPAPYLAAMLAGLVILPVLVWNAEHGWVSFVFQSSRSVASGGLKPMAALRVALGQIAFLSPWMFVPLVAGIVSGLRGWRDRRRLFLLCLSLPPIAFFTIAPLWIARGQPHWAMAGWFFAFPLMGAWAQELPVPVRSLRRYATLSAVLLAALTVGAGVEARTGWVWRFLPAGTVDPTLEALDWSGLVNAPLLQPSPPFVISTRWQEAGKITLALGPNVPILVVSNDPRGWMFVNKGTDLAGRDGVLIVQPKDLAVARAALAPLFASLGEAQPFMLLRNGAPAAELMLVPARGSRADPSPRSN